MADSLRQKGHEVVYLGCDGIYTSFCTSMYYQGLSYDSPPEEKNKLCAICRRRRGVIAREFPFRHKDIGDYLEPGEAADAAAAAAGATVGNLESLGREGVALGKFSLYQLLIAFKKFNLDLNEVEQGQFRALYEGAVKTFHAWKRFLVEERPDAVLFYNGLSTNERTVMEMCHKSGIPTYFMHGGASADQRFETLILGRTQTYDYFVALKEMWRRGPERIQLTEDDFVRVTKHFQALLSGKNSVLSLPKTRSELDIRKKFGIPEGAKLLLATLSSYDEIFAAQMAQAIPYEKLPFESQAEWVRKLLELIRGRDDLFLVIRIHPREFHKDSLGRISQHASDLVAAFANLPPNARLNLPEDEVSLYDFAGEADVVLNAWSTAGEDLGMLGIPVVNYCDLLLLSPPELGYYATSWAEYKDHLFTALREGPSLERAFAFWRWRAVYLSRTVIRVGESFFPHIPVAGLWRRAFAKVRRTIQPSYREQADSRRRKPLSQISEIEDLVTKELPTLAHLERRVDGPLALDRAMEWSVFRREFESTVNSLFGQDAGGTSSKFRRMLRP